MTGSRFLIDTNIVIALFAGEAGVQSRLAAATEVFLPSIAVGELLYGARKSSRVAENVRRVEEFAASIAVLPCDAKSAAAYGEVKASLSAKGKPIPENDVWIAAIAHQHGLTLVSRDEHFRQVDNLSVEKW